MKSGDIELQRLDILAGWCHDVRKALSASDLWHLARLPVREAHFEDVARAACLGEQVVFGSLDSLVDEQLEDEVQRLGDVLMASRRFPSILVGDDAVDEDDACLAAVACHEALYLYGSRLIGHGVGRQIDDAHLCKVCGQPKGPNSKIKDRQCRRCFAIQDREAAQAARQLARFQRPQATRYAVDAAGPPLNYALGPQPTQSYSAGAYATAGAAGHERRRPRSFKSAAGRPPRRAQGPPRPAGAESAAGCARRAAESGAARRRRSSRTPAGPAAASTRRPRPSRRVVAAARRHRPPRAHPGTPKHAEPGTSRHANRGVGAVEKPEEARAASATRRAAEPGVRRRRGRIRPPERAEQSEASRRAARRGRGSWARRSRSRGRRMWGPTAPATRVARLLTCQ